MPKKCDAIIYERCPKSKDLKWISEKRGTIMYEGYLTSEIKKNIYKICPRSEIQTFMRDI